MYCIHLLFSQCLIIAPNGLYMLVLIASPRWRWCLGEYLLVPYGFRFCMQPANIPQDNSTIWEKLIKPTYRAHLFDEVSTPLKGLYWIADSVCEARHVPSEIGANKVLENDVEVSA